MIMSFKMHWRTVDLGYCSSFYMNCRAHKKCLFAKNNRYSKNIWNLWVQNLTCFHGTLVQYAQACQCWMKDLVWCWEQAPEIHLHQENPGQWTIWNWLSRCQGSSKCPCLTFNCWPCFLSLLALCLTSSTQQLSPLTTSRSQWTHSRHCFTLQCCRRAAAEQDANAG